MIALPVAVFLIGCALIVIAGFTAVAGLATIALGEEVPGWAPIAGIITGLLGGIAVLASHLMATA